MAASDHLGEQLKMFMTAQEIKGYVNNSMDLSYPFFHDVDTPQTMEELWSEKLENSKQPYHRHVLGSGVYDALKSGKDIFVDNDNPYDDGTVSIELDDSGREGKDRTMINHHHRIAAQADIESKAMDNWHPPQRLPQQRLIPIRYITPDENPRYEGEEW